MYDLLLHAKTHDRIDSRLKTFSDKVAPCILQDDGEILRPQGNPPSDKLIAFGTTDAFFSKAAGTFVATLVEHPQLVWFQSSAAGLEHPVLQSIGAHARRYTACHEQSEAIAEWVLWAGLDFFQNGPKRRKLQADRSWTRLGAREISSTRWLMVGFGAIGQAAGRRLKALGAHVTGLRRRVEPSEAADRVVSIDALRDELGDADAVLLALPHTDETESIANATFFDAMREDALFLNVGRGALVDEAALLAALDKGKPAHAALDVLREEPQPADGPFWHHPAVTLTSHISALTESSKLRTDALFLRNIERFLKDEPLENEIPRSIFE